MQTRNMSLQGKGRTCYKNMKIKHQFVTDFVNGTFTFFTENTLEILDTWTQQSLDK